MKNIRLQYAAWEALPSEFQSLFVQWQGNDPVRGQTFYELYFYWFDIAHVLREQYGSTESSHGDDETAVNSFAQRLQHYPIQCPRTKIVRSTLTSIIWS